MFEGVDIFGCVDWGSMGLGVSWVAGFVVFCLVFNFFYVLLLFLFSVRLLLVNICQCVLGREGGGLEYRRHGYTVGQRIYFSPSYMFPTSKFTSLEQMFYSLVMKVRGD